VKITAIHRKLFRDLWRIRGQALAVAMVIGAGVAMFVLLHSAFDSLDLTLRTYYERYGFGDVFTMLKRAPLWVEDGIREIPGVARVETRVVVDVNLDVPGLGDPALGRLISVPEKRRAVLCDVFLRSGRYIEPGRPEEVLVNEPFAKANGLGPGDTVKAVINGRRQELRIVGVALSPEYIYAIRPGELIADDRRFGIFWMGRRALATAYDMEGGFNDVVLTVTRDASVPEVISRLDRVLETYGGLGAVDRSLQMSHFYLQSELDGLTGLGAVVPTIFLAVAAFLLNVVMTRIVQVQREEIASLKAVGYSNAAVGGHYMLWGLVVALAGAALGLGAGAWLGRGMTRMYADFYNFPILQYRLPADLVAKAVLASLAAALLGSLVAVRQVVKLPPAEAMRPEAPARFRQSWVERAGLGALLSQPTRIVLRNLQRHPGRAALSVAGIALGGAMVIVGSFTMDTVDHIMDLQFNVAQRFDAMVSFVEPLSPRALHEVRRLTGVLQAEPFRAVPARLRFGPHHRNTAITGLPPHASLNRIVDEKGRVASLPSGGMVMSAKLAQILDASVGDEITVEVLEGSRPVRRVVVAGLVDDTMGANAYMDLAALNRLMHEGSVLSGAYLQVDGALLDDLYRTLKEIPAVAGVMLKGAAYESFQDTIAKNFDMVRRVTQLFAAIIAFGVVYNSARISLSERARELATLRVLGFRRAEISFILLGELALLTILAIPLGMVLGYLLAAWTVTLYDTEVYRLPLIVAPRTYALAAVTVLAAAVFSGWAVRRRLAHLDLIAVLKTRE